MCPGTSGTAVLKEREGAKLDESSVSIGLGARMKAPGMLPGTPDWNRSRTTYTMYSQARR